MLQKLKISLISLLLLTAGAAAAQQGLDPNRVKIGFAAPSTDNPWFTGVRLGMERFCSEKGISYSFADGMGSAQTQAVVVEKMLSEGLDAILVTPLDPELIAPIFQKAKQRGVVTGSLAQLVPGSDLLYGMIEYDYGFVIGEQAANWAKKTLDCEGTAVIITHDNVEAVKERGIGIEQALHQICPFMTIAARESGSTMLAGHDIVLRALRTYPKLNLVIAANDAGGIGGYEAMAAAGLTGSDKAVFSGDASREAIALMRDENSIYRGTVELYPYQCGYQAARYLYEMVILGIPSEPRYERLSYHPVSKEDVVSGKYYLSY